jgi:hypothetical protein
MRKQAPFHPAFAEGKEGRGGEVSHRNKACRTASSNNNKNNHLEKKKQPTIL